MSLCSVGLYMNSECNKLIYSIVGVNYLESFERDDLELIFWRSGLTILKSMQSYVITMNKLF